MEIVRAWLPELGLWGLLTALGYVYLGIAPLDPHNPAALPGRWSRMIWSAVAATSLLVSLTTQGTTALFFASLAVGTILSPGLNDPLHLRRDEEPSWLARIFSRCLRGYAGGWMLKALGLLLGWLSSLLWPPLWLLTLAALASVSITARAGILVGRRSDKEQVAKDLDEAMGASGSAPPMSISPEIREYLRSASERQIKDTFPSFLARRLIKSKKIDGFERYGAINYVMPKVMASVFALCVWIVIAADLIFTNGHIAIDASNYSGAYGLLFGFGVALVFEAIGR